MIKEELFKFIREEKTILFTGAGISIYAGYPSGKKLAKIIFDSLSKNEKDQISDKKNLSKLCKEYEILKDGREELIMLLKKIFIEKIADSTETHRLISKIPHFKEIITTNYDNLFEIAFNGQINKFVTVDDLVNYQNDFPNYYKIHGDLSIPDTIIITENDYLNKFFNNLNIEYWSTITNLFLRKHIIFIGYNLDDPNIQLIFNNISKVLKGNMKDSFFIAPNVSRIKSRELQQLGVKYIDSTAETFLNELNENIKSNITFDLNNGITNTETVNKYINGLGLQLTLQNITGNQKFKTLLKSAGETYSKLKLKIDKNDEEFFQEFKDFTEGKKFGSLEISEKLISIDLRTEGIKHPITLNKDFKLKFESQPSLTINIDIRFKNRFELNNIPIKVFGSIYLIEVDLVLNKIYFKIVLKPNENNIDVTINYNHIDQLSSNVNDELKSHNFLISLFSGVEFELFRNSKKEFAYSLPVNTEIVENSKKIVSYLEDLKLVEQYYSVQFRNFKMSDKSYNVLRKVVSKINNKPIIYDNNYNLEFKCELKHKAAKEKILISLQHDHCRITSGRKDEVVNLHGTEINLGMSEIIYFDPKLVNEGDSDDRLIVCKCKKIQVTYK